MGNLPWVQKNFTAVVLGIVVISVVPVLIELWQVREGGLSGGMLPVLIELSQVSARRGHAGEGGGGAGPCRRGRGGDGGMYERKGGRGHVWKVPEEVRIRATVEWGVGGRVGMLPVLTELSQVSARRAGGV